MRFAPSFLMAALQLGAALSSPVEETTGECGALGIMDVDMSKLPSSVNTSEIRTCAGHPAGTSPDALTKRSCYWGKKRAGCSKGYCWKKCGSNGQWCWSAYNDGYGDWIGCNKDSQCNVNQACGLGNCKDCGCSC